MTLKLSILPAIAALGVVLGVASPAFAQSSFSNRTAQSVPFCDTDTDVTGNVDVIAQNLGTRGYDVSAVDEWGGCARAYVTNASGSQEMVFFDPDTLKEVGRVTYL